MAQLLQDDDSTDRHLAVTRRFTRRCAATRGADALAAGVGSARDALVAAQQETVLRSTDEEDRKDDLELRGLDAADTLRTLSGRAEEHDRTTDGAEAHASLFIEGGFGALLDSKGQLSDEKAELVATRVTALGTDHPLASFATQLTDLATGIRAAEAAVQEAIRARKQAEANEEIAQAALRKAYEHAYLDARKVLGKVRVERLFPTFRAARRKKPKSSGPTEG